MPPPLLSRESFQEPAGASVSSRLIRFVLVLCRELSVVPGSAQRLPKLSSCRQPISDAVTSPDGVRQRKVRGLQRKSPSWTTRSGRAGNCCYCRCRFRFHYRFHLCLHSHCRHSRPSRGIRRPRQSRRRAQAATTPSPASGSSSPRPPCRVGEGDSPRPRLAPVVGL